MNNHISLHEIMLGGTSLIFFLSIFHRLGAKPNGKIITPLELKYKVACTASNLQVISDFNMQ